LAPWEKQGTTLANWGSVGEPITKKGEDWQLLESIRIAVAAWLQAFICFCGRPPPDYVHISAPFSFL
jgi:hypothetical protein